MPNKFVFSFQQRNRPDTTSVIVPADDVQAAAEKLKMFMPGALDYGYSVRNISYEIPAELCTKSFRCGIKAGHKGDCQELECNDHYKWVNILLGKTDYLAMPEKEKAPKVKKDRSVCGVDGCDNPNCPQCK